MRNKRKVQELKTEIIALRNKEHDIKCQLTDKMLDLYLAMGFTPEQSAGMV